MPQITKSVHEAQNTPRWFWALFLVLTLFVYLFGLTIPLVGPDEPRYAQVAREMFERGDLITPTLGGSVWFEKPAMLYWLEMAAYAIFGVNEFAARLGPALFGLGTVASLWIIGRYAAEGTMTEKRESANRLALLAASTLGIIVFSRGASFDIVVTFPIAAAMAAFVVHGSSEGDSRARRAVCLALFYSFIGVALLAKGLIGVLFPIGIPALYFVLRRRFPSREVLASLMWGLPLATLVASVWYVPMYIQHGERFVDEFIIQHHFQRFTSNKYQHPQPFYFFFWVLPLMTIPWLPFFAVSVWQSLRSFLHRIRFDTVDTGSTKSLSGSELERLAAAWILVPLVFFSFSGSKLPGYILPALPGAVLLTSLSISRLVKRSVIWSKSIMALALATYAVVVGLLIFVVPDLANRESVKGLVEAADLKGYSALQVTGFDTVSHNAEFYAAGRLVRDDQGKQRKFMGAHELAEFIDKSGGRPIVVLVPIEHVRRVSGSDLLKTEVIAENGELAILVVKRR